MTIKITEQNRGEAEQLLQTAFAMRDLQNEYFELDRKAKGQKSLYPERNQALNLAKSVERSFDKRRAEFEKGLANG